MFVELTKKVDEGYPITINTDKIVLFRASCGGTYIELSRDTECLPYIQVVEDYETVKRRINAED